MTTDTTDTGSEREAWLDVEETLARILHEKFMMPGHAYPDSPWKDACAESADQLLDYLGRAGLTLRSAAPTGATPDPSIPERPDLSPHVDPEYRASLDEIEPHDLTPYQRGYVDGFDAPVNVVARAIPERPAEPLREALTTILGIVEESSGSLPSLDRAAVERLARAALQSTPESRPLTCHADGSPCDICAILVGKESPR